MVVRRDVGRCGPVGAGLDTLVSRSCQSSGVRLRVRYLPRASSVHDQGTDVARAKGSGFGFGTASRLRYAVHEERFVSITSKRSILHCPIIYIETERERAE